VRFISADIEDLADDRTRVRVELHRQSGETYVGMVEGSSSSAVTLQCAAHAAMDAARQAAGATGDYPAIENVAVSETLGQQTVFVAITNHYDRRVRPLLGLCVVHANLIQAVAFAVLNATNRVLGIG